MVAWACQTSFACRPIGRAGLHTGKEIFDHLENAKQNGDCSLSDGVRSMAAANKARAIDIGDAWWQDVDTNDMLAVAEGRLRERMAKETRVASIPAGRFGQPQDIAGLAVFLASDESSWMTGTAIPVDGGVTAA